MPGYYDIDDILMEDEPISVVFQVTANGVGLLDPGAESNFVEKGAKVDLPFWLAHGLLSLEQAVSMNPPPCYTQKTRKEIQADAACVDLRVRCPYFYELGCKIVPLVNDKSIGMFLRYAFTSRYKEVLSKSHSSSTMTVPKFVPRLTKEETRDSLCFRQVFESARESMAAFKKWRAGGVRLQKATILGRKRKTKLPDGPSTP
ncbi:DNA replication complex GINS protein PSF3 isoform X1 [Setaria viridis]|uniref:DNA replication complex GINS protein PSF3 isoform X1 n=1 Tax=Setaria viridis TaxID=4556 RepID=UPI001493DCFB|nr:DNA replication complex GINS protein PSF3-like isoform X1 [Setaria viridis]XP_034599990.1 DNA replication complex GINS protein PSF3-like isoform X1 [Setaria viridis]XP_034599992.1 DNA replication complex GINS protein PSF3-like isoform X1 [Setaria viridis]